MGFTTKQSSVNASLFCLEKDMKYLIIHRKNVNCFFRGNPWIGSGEQPERDKHARDIPFLDNYSMERWEVGVHMDLIIIIFRLGHQSKFLSLITMGLTKIKQKGKVFFFFSEELLLCLITLYTLTSLSIFSTLFPICFFWYWQGEFIWRSKLLRLAVISFILMILIKYGSAVFL